MLVARRTINPTLMLLLFASTAHAQTLANKPDSIMLNRSSCYYGGCPVYRVVLTRQEGIHYGGGTQIPRTPATDSLFFKIADAAKRIDLPSFPVKIASDKNYCPSEWTHSPTATITLFGPSRIDSVEDYQGCASKLDSLFSKGSWSASPYRERMASLRALEAAIDSAAGMSTPVVGSVDSIELTRGTCFGSCVPYKVRITKAGIVRFLPPGFRPPEMTDTVPASSFTALVSAAAAIDFFTIPKSISDDSIFCPKGRSSRISDMPVVSVVLYSAQVTHEVMDGGACTISAPGAIRTRTHALRNLQNLIDEVTKSARWIRQ